MRQALINLYEFSELNEKAKTVAISEHYDFLCSVGEWDEENDENANEYIKENIELNEYLFYSNGELANVTQYCGKHEKAGTIELKLGNDIYPIN